MSAFHSTFCVSKSFFPSKNSNILISIPWSSLHVACSLSRGGKFSRKLTSTGTSQSSFSNVFAVFIDLKMAQLG